MIVGQHSLFDALFDLEQSKMGSETTQADFAQLIVD